MADNTAIEWADATWQPITGCSVVSPGCTNCYAMRLAGTRLQHHPSRAGLTIDSKAGPVWNGLVRLNEDWLDQPLRWKRGRRVFVCAHGDLFHEAAPDEWIDRVFAVMALTPQHSFLVLTKRAERMRAYMRDVEREALWMNAVAAAIERYKLFGLRHEYLEYRDPWVPLPNVWLGVSVEDQTRADERIPLLLDTPAATRFISAEPLLAPVDLTRLQDFNGHWWDAIAGEHWVPGAGSENSRTFRTANLDWIIVGGESGPGARPMHPAWARSLRDQCRTADIRFFFKQWGEWMPTSGVDVYCHGPNRREREFPNSPGISWLRDGRICFRDFTVTEHAERIRSGRAYNTRAIEVDEVALNDFNTACRRAEDADAGNPFAELGYQWMYRVGKKAAGRLLDGRTWDEFPA